MLLLDTHAIIWIGEGEPIERKARRAVEAARLEGGVLVSPISAWEIGLLVTKGRILTLVPTPAEWLARFLAQPGVREVRLTMRAALDSCFLPEPFPGDPADRMLISIARELAIPLLTRDRLILAYAAKSGAVKTIRC
ncbi:MAG TPA: type II toxin-antitoxin system VapC family toxin [Alphaproteobacteria bacterium]|nr:type II toxin-antitoxin system VapC family toxin [Alphaproteobacteria bacterium]